jgi:hypothetical protein
MYMPKYMRKVIFLLNYYIMLTVNFYKELKRKIFIFYKKYTICIFLFAKQKWGKLC